MKEFKKIGLLLLAAILLFDICSCSGKTEKLKEQILYYNMATEPVTLDPQIVADAGARLVITNIFEGLVRLGEKEEIVPGAAESWEISPDGLRYSFNLRKDLRWSDGTELTAKDFAFGLTRALKPETNCPQAEELYCIKNAEKFHENPASTLGIFAKNSRTLVIELEYRCSDFLHVMALPCAMPCKREFFEKTAGRYGCDADMVLSNGAFYIPKNNWEHSHYLNIRRNDYYTGESQPVILGVNISISEIADSYTAIHEGKIDGGCIKKTDVSQAKNENFQITSFEDTVYGIAFRTQDTALAQAKIRTALLSAVNKKEIQNFLTESEIPTGNIIADSSYRSRAGDCQQLNFSANAKEKLKSAMKELNLKKLPSLTILCTDDEMTQQMVNSLIVSWNELTGSHVNKKAVSLAELKQKIWDKEDSYNIVIAPLSLQGTNPLETLALFRTNSEYNIADLQNESYDAMLNTAQNFKKENDYYLKILDAENYLILNGIFYPVYIQKKYYACPENVTGIIFHPYGAEADFLHAEKN